MRTAVLDSSHSLPSMAIAARSAPSHQATPVAPQVGAAVCSGPGAAAQWSQIKPPFPPEARTSLPDPVRLIKAASFAGHSMKPTRGLEPRTPSLRESPKPSHDGWF